jgi:hemolysin activation/secretion protein
MIGGENAVSLRNELSYRASFGNEAVETLLGQGVLFGALDLGWVFPGESGSATTGNIAGVAGGVRLQNGLIFGEVSIEHALYSSRPADDQAVYRFNLGIAPIRF